MKKSKRIMTLCIMFFAAMFLSPAQVISEGMDAYQVRYTVQFSTGDLSFEKFLGYDVVGLREASYPGELGKPMLSAIQLQMALPAGMEVRSVEVVNTTQEEIQGEFNLLPIQPPRKIGDSGDDVAFVQPDEEIYSSKKPYPLELVEFVHQADLAGQGIAVLRLNPVRYVPAEKKLTLYTSISFVIEGVDGYKCGHYLSPNISEKGRRTYEQMVKDMVANPEDVQLQTGLINKSTAVEGGPFDHVIITGPLHAAWYDPLVEWHNQKGVRDTVVTPDWIYANYSGSTDQQKIRNFIIDANTEWGTIYFLLGGEHETVPFEYRNYFEGSTPSDQYYSDFDDDWTNEVFVGRATAESGFEIQTFVLKVLKYEKDPPRTDYPLDILLLGMDYDEYTPVEELKENIDFGYIPPRFNVTKVYDSDPYPPPPTHKQAFIDALNAGQNLVNHADHSYIEYMGTGDQNHDWRIYSSDVDALSNNDQTSVVVSTGCHPNHMDFNDCIAEHFVIYNPNQAAVAFTGNTRNGLYYSGNPISLTNALDKQWWVRLFFWDKYNLGQVLAEAKHHFSHLTNNEKHCEWTFNLLGEPEMPIWTDEPDSFAVTCPLGALEGKTSFPVHVEDSTTHDPVNLAYVCLWREGKVYLTGYTDINGDVTFDPAPATAGTLWVTVTKHNYIPHQQVATIDYICGDANGDGMVDIADVVVLIQYLLSGGPAPEPYEAGDANGDTRVDIADIIALIRHLREPSDPIYCYGDRPCGDRGERDSLIILGIWGSAGDTVDVPIYVFNDDSVWFQLCLSIPDPSQAIFLDTVITESTRLEEMDALRILHDTTGIQMYWTPEYPDDSTDFLVPGHGIVAYLRCVLKQDISPGSALCIDTTFFPPGHWTGFYTRDTYCIIPEFECIPPPMFAAHFMTPEGEPYPFDVIVSDGEWVQEFISVTYLELEVPTEVTITYQYQRGTLPVVRRWKLSFSPGEMREYEIYALDAAQLEPRARPYILWQEAGANGSLSWNWNPVDNTLSWDVSCEPGKQGGVSVVIDSNVQLTPNYVLAECGKSSCEKCESPSQDIHHFYWESGTVQASFEAIDPTEGTVRVGYALHNDTILVYPITTGLHSLDGTEYEPEYVDPEYAVPAGSYLLSTESLPEEYALLDFPLNVKAGREIRLYDIHLPKIAELEPFTFHLAAEDFWANSSHSNLLHAPDDSIAVDVSTGIAYQDWWGCFVLPTTWTVDSLSAYSDTVGVAELAELQDFTACHIQDSDLFLVVVRIKPSYDRLNLTYALRGDVTQDDIVDVGDVVYLINYLYRGGPAPRPLDRGDVNCDEVVNIGDVIYLINYLYKGGPPPGGYQRIAAR